MIDGVEVLKRIEKSMADWPYLAQCPEYTYEMLESAHKLLKEQESVIQTLKSDLNETLQVLSEQPEIIRCKDCKHWRQLYGDKPFYSHIGCCDCDDVSRKINDCGCYPDFRTDSDWFCADGERKDDG